MTGVGSCVFDLVGLREGKYQLSVDGRGIIGSRETIESLQKVLGGEISKADSRPEERSEESSTDETYSNPARSHMNLRASARLKRRAVQWK